MTSSRIDLDRYYLLLASFVALRSTCVRRRVGCLLVDSHGYILSAGFNGSPSNSPHCIDQPCEGAFLPTGTGLDKCEAIHAEANACVRLKEPLNVRTAYVTVSPCTSCIKLLLGTSTQRIVAIEEYTDTGGKNLWARAGRDWIIIPDLKNLVDDVTTTVILENRNIKAIPYWPWKENEK